MVGYRYLCNKTSVKKMRFLLFMCYMHPATGPLFVVKMCELYLNFYGNYGTITCVYVFQSTDLYTVPQLPEPRTARYPRSSARMLPHDKISRMSPERLLTTQKMPLIC